MSVDQQPQWVQAMWKELDTYSEPEQIVIAGQFITLMTNDLLTQLGERRRVLAATLLLRPGMDTTSLAEQIGSRRNAVARLAEEGRRILRSKGFPVPEPEAE